MQLTSAERAKESRKASSPQTLNKLVSGSPLNWSTKRITKSDSASRSPRNRSSGTLLSGCNRRYQSGLLIRFTRIRSYLLKKCYARPSAKMLWIYYKWHSRNSVIIKGVTNPLAKGTKFEIVKRELIRIHRRFRITWKSNKPLFQPKIGQ